MHFSIIPIQARWSAAAPVGFWAAGASLALTAGPLVGGALITLTGWRSIFLVNLPIGLGALWLTWRYVTDTKRTKHQLDLPGQVVAIAMLGVLAGAIIEGGRAGWENPWIISSFGVFIILAALFLMQEHNTQQPMLPLYLFAHQMFALTSLVGLLVNIACYGLIFVFSLYFQQINGWSPLSTGLAFVPMMGVVLPVNLIAPRLAERFGAPAVIAAGCLIATSGCLTLLGIEPGTSYWAICAQLVGAREWRPVCSTRPGKRAAYRRGVIWISDRANQRVHVGCSRSVDHFCSALDRGSRRNIECCLSPPKTVSLKTVVHFR